MVMFHGYVSHNQMVTHSLSHADWWPSTVCGITLGRHLPKLPIDGLQAAEGQRNKEHQQYEEEHQEDEEVDEKSTEFWEKWVTYGDLTAKMFEQFECSSLCIFQCSTRC